MDYNTRLRLITDHLNTFLRRFRRPEHLGVDQSFIELRSMADAINSRISASCAPEDLAERMADVFQAVVETHRGRDWPKVADFVTAMKSTHRAVAGHGSQADQGREMMDWARKLWFHGTDACPAKTVIAPANTWEIAQRLIAEGADPWEIRMSGFQTDTKYYRNLEETGRGWKGSDAVIDRLARGFMGEAG